MLGAVFIRNLGNDRHPAFVAFFPVEGVFWSKDLHVFSYDIPSQASPACAECACNIAAFVFLSFCQHLYVSLCSCKLIKLNLCSVNRSSQALLVCLFYEQKSVPQEAESAAWGGGERKWGWHGVEGVVIPRLQHTVALKGNTVTEVLLTAVQSLPSHHF